MQLPSRAVPTTVAEEVGIAPGSPTMLGGTVESALVGCVIGAEFGIARAG
jgi:hypothetical protein